MIVYRLFFVLFSTMCIFSANIRGYPGEEKSKKSRFKNLEWIPKPPEASECATSKRTEFVKSSDLHVDTKSKMVVGDSFKSSKSPCSKPVITPDDCRGKGKVWVPHSERDNREKSNDNYDDNSRARIPNLKFKEREMMGPNVRDSKFKGREIIGPNVRDSKFKEREIIGPNVRDLKSQLYTPKTNVQHFTKEYSMERISPPDPTILPKPSSNILQRKSGEVEGVSSSHRISSIDHRESKKSTKYSACLANENASKNSEYLTDKNAKEKSEDPAKETVIPRYEIKNKEKYSKRDDKIMPERITNEPSRFESKSQKNEKSRVYRKVIAQNVGENIAESEEKSKILPKSEEKRVITDITPRKSEKKGEEKSHRRENSISSEISECSLNLPNDLLPDFSDYAVNKQPENPNLDNIFQNENLIASEKKSTDNTSSKTGSAETSSATPSTSKTTADKYSEALARKKFIFVGEENFLNPISTKVTIIDENEKILFEKIIDKSVKIAVGVEMELKHITAKEEIAQLMEDKIVVGYRVRDFLMKWNLYLEDWRIRDIFTLTKFTNILTSNDPHKWPSELVIYEHFFTREIVATTEIRCGSYLRAKANLELYKKFSSMWEAEMQKLIPYLRGWRNIYELQNEIRLSSYVGFHYDGKIFKAEFVEELCPPILVGLHAEKLGTYKSRKFTVITIQGQIIYRGLERQQMRLIENAANDFTGPPDVIRSQLRDVLMGKIVVGFNILPDLFILNQNFDLVCDKIYDTSDIFKITNFGAMIRKLLYWEREEEDLTSVEKARVSLQLYSLYSFHKNHRVAYHKFRRPFRNGTWV